MYHGDGCSLNGCFLGGCFLDGWFLDGYFWPDKRSCSTKEAAQGHYVYLTTFIAVIHYKKWPVVESWRVLMNEWINLMNELIWQFHNGSFSYSLGIVNILEEQLQIFAPARAGAHLRFLEGKGLNFEMRANVQAARYKLQILYA